MDHFHRTEDLVCWEITIPSLLAKSGRYQNTNGQNTNDHNTNLIGILIGSVGILIGSVGILIGSVGILIGSVGILNIFRTALFVVGIMKFRLVF